jgi:hypothetical protein
MDDLGTPGLLVDAQRLLLVRQGADAPFAEIVRAEATWEDIALIRDLHLEQRRGEGLYLACMPVQGQGDVPVVVIRAASPHVAAVEALPIIDAPVFRDIAAKFLEGAAIEVVAEEYLGGSLLDPHAVATVLGRPLPEERPELRRMLGDLYDPRIPRRARRMPNRG